MSRKWRIETVFLCAGVLVLVLACMVLPAAFCALQQERLLQSTHLRPKAENVLSEQGQKNPLAKLLYDRQYLVGTAPEWDSTGWQALEQAEEEQVKTIHAVVERLHNNSLLSETQAEAVEELLGGQQPITLQTALQDEAGFVRYERSTQTDSLLLELCPGGEVAHLRWSGGTGQLGAAELLETYKLCLKVTEFSDWQDLSSENGHLAAAYSPTAQLYVYASDRGGIEFGVEHKTPEQIAMATGSDEEETR